MRYEDVNVGPLHVHKIKGSEIQPGDVFLYGWRKWSERRYVVVMRAYPLEHLREMNLDLDIGEDSIPGQIGMDTEYLVFRAG